MSGQKAAARRLTLGEPPVAVLEIKRIAIYSI